MNVFALSSQRFSAGRQNVEIRIISKQALYHCCRLRDQVLAAVQNEQDALAPKMRCELWYRILRLDRKAKRGRDCRGQELRRTDRTEFHKAYHADKFAQERMSDRKRRRRLSNAPGPRMVTNLSASSFLRIVRTSSSRPTMRASGGGNEYVDSIAESVSGVSSIVAREVGATRL